MCCKNLRKTYIPFLLAFMFGSLMANFFSVSKIPLNLLEKKFASLSVIKKEKAIVYKEEGSGYCHGLSPEQTEKLSKTVYCFACKDGKFVSTKKIEPKSVSDSRRTPIKFLSKPQPKYTEEATQNNIQGNVVLRITFLANGQLGSISTVKELPFGLSEQAIEAARKIKFEPALKNGQPYSVTKSVQYNFSIY